MAETEPQPATQSSSGRFFSALIVGIVLLPVIAIAVMSYTNRIEQERRDVAQAKSIFADDVAFLETLGRIARATRDTRKLEEWAKKTKAEETIFVSTCRRCADAEKCERDRQAVAAGRSSNTYNPCD